MEAGTDIREYRAAGRTGVESTLPLQAYFQIYDDAWALNKQIASLQKRVEKFQDKAQAPVWGSWLFLYGHYSLQEMTGVAGEEAGNFLVKARTASWKSRYFNLASNPQNSYAKTSDPSCGVAGSVNGATPPDALQTSSAQQAKPKPRSAPVAAGSSGGSIGQDQNELRKGRPEAPTMASVFYPQGDFESNCNGPQIESDVKRRSNTNGPDN